MTKPHAKHGASHSPLVVQSVQSLSSSLIISSSVRSYFMSVNDQICPVTMWCGNYWGQIIEKTYRTLTRYTHERFMVSWEQCQNQKKHTGTLGRPGTPECSFPRLFSDTQNLVYYRLMMGHDGSKMSMSRNTRSRPLGRSVIIAPWADSLRHTGYNQVRQAWTIILNVFHYKQCRRASSRCLQRGFQALNRTL